MTKHKQSELNLFSRDLLGTIESLISPYVHRVKERLEIMRKAQEKRTAPQRYLKTLQELSPKHPDDWRAGDVCFFQRYEKDPELYEKLTKIREDYLKNKS